MSKYLRTEIITREDFQDKLEYCQKEELCVLPDEDFVRVETKAFYDWQNCKYLVIPYNVHYIAPDAFLWSNLEVIFVYKKDLLPPDISATIYPYTDFYLIYVNLYKRLNLIEEKIQINIESLIEKRKIIEDYILETNNSLDVSLQGLKVKSSKLKTLYAELKELAEESTLLNQSLLNKIREEIAKEVSGLVKQLKEEDENISKKHQDLDEHYATLKKNIEELTRQFEEHCKNIKSKQCKQTEKILSRIDEELSRVQESIKQFSQVVAEEALKIVRNSNPYNNINIFINNDLKSILKGKLTHKSLESVIKLLSLKLHPLLVGPAGSGKNVILEQAAEALNLKFYYVNDVTEEHKVMGFVDANGTFQETQFFKAFTKGGLIMIDEMDNSHPSALLAINAAIGTGYNQYLSFPDGNFYHAAEDFYLAAAANTFGVGADMIYSGRNALDGASLNRFVTIYIDYDRDLERALINNTEILPLFWAVREAIQKNKIRHVISTRNIVNADKLLESKMFSIESIFEFTIIQGLSNEDLRIILNDLDDSNLDKYINEFKNYLYRTKGIERNDLRRIYNEGY